MRLLSSRLSLDRSFSLHCSRHTCLRGYTCKRQRLVLLPKAVKLPGELSYRPILFLDTVSKILERVIYNRLLAIIEGRRYFSDRQYGFRESRSINNTIGLVTDFAENPIHGKGSICKCCVLFTLRMSNALNTARCYYR